MANPASAPEHVVVIAASLGGVRAVGTVLSGLDAEFPAVIALVQHRAPSDESSLEEILGRTTSLRVVRAADMGTD